MPTPSGCEFLPYPTEDQAKEAVCRLANNQGDLCCTKHCKWVLEGFLLSTDAPMPAPEPCTPDEARQKLAKTLEQCRGTDVVSTKKKAINWAALFALVLSFLQQIFPQPLPGPAPAPAPAGK